MGYWKYYFNVEKEEEWLNVMLHKGYLLTTKSFCSYYFKKVDGSFQESIIRMDYHLFQKDQDFNDYCALFEDSGWKHVCGTKMSGSQYFLKMYSDSNDEIFSDVRSKAARYKRISNMWLGVFTTFLPLTIVFLMGDTYNINHFLNPKSLYITPGLWDMKGLDFWRQFLIETPIVLFRNLYFIVIILYVVFGFYFFIKYRKELSREGHQDV